MRRAIGIAMIVAPMALLYWLVPSERFALESVAGFLAFLVYGACVIHMIVG